MPRNRRKLKVRAAAWKSKKQHQYDGTVEDAAARMLTGKGLNEFIHGSGSGQQPKGILS